MRNEGIRLSRAARGAYVEPGCTRNILLRRNVPDHPKYQKSSIICSRDARWRKKATGCATRLTSQRQSWLDWIIGCCKYGKKIETQVRPADRVKDARPHPMAKPDRLRHECKGKLSRPYEVRFRKSELFPFVAAAGHFCLGLRRADRRVTTNGKRSFCGRPGPRNRAYGRCGCRSCRLCQLC